MFTIKTYIAPSGIHGMGVFSAEFVAKDDVVWKFQEGFDVIVSDGDFQSLPDIAKQWIIHYGYYNKDEGGYVLCMDNAKYTNHSVTPSIRAVGKVAMAIRDLQKDEEITEDYYNFDELAKVKLGK